MIMKAFLLLLSMLSYLILSAQDKEEKQSIDFIISVDGEIVKAISRSRIVSIGSNIDVKSIPVFYYPGDLSVYKIDMDYIMSLSDSVKLQLEFDYYSYTTKGDQNVLNYKIEIDKSWLKQSYLILYLYNTDKKRYREKLEPIPGSKYTFELDYPGGQMLRLRKK